MSNWLQNTVTNLSNSVLNRTVAFCSLTNSITYSRNSSIKLPLEPFKAANHSPLSCSRNSFLTWWTWNLASLFFSKSLNFWNSTRLNSNALSFTTSNSKSYSSNNKPSQSQHPSFIILTISTTKTTVFQSILPPSPLTILLFPKATNETPNHWSKTLTAIVINLNLILSLLSMISTSALSTLPPLRMKNNTLLVPWSSSNTSNNCKTN